MEKILTNPYFMGVFGATMAIGLLILGITYLLFRFLRKRIAEDIIGMPAPGGPDSETWPYRSITPTAGFIPPVKCPWPCNEHKSLVERIGGMDSELGEVEGRQKSLREDVLPEKYVARRDYDACKKDRQTHETELFNRVGVLERKQGGP